MTIPTINKRFLLQLLLLTMLGSGALFGVHYLQARRIPESLRKHAERADAQGDTDKAIHYLRQYLEFETTDVEAMAELAKHMRERAFRKNQPIDMMGLYDKILRLDPGHSLTRVEALKNAMRTGRYIDAATHASWLIEKYPANRATLSEAEQKTWSEIQLRDLWIDMAIAQTGMMKRQEAISSYQKAIDINPLDPEPYRYFAEFYLKEMKQPESALQVLNRLIEALPQDPVGYILRARLNIMEQKPEFIAQELRKALELDPYHPEALLLLGQHLQARRDLAGAKDCYVDGLKFQPGDLELIRNLAWLELNRGNYGSAVNALEEGMNHTNESDQFQLLIALADLLVQLGDQDRPKTILAKLERNKGKSAAMQALYLRGRLSMQSKEWQQAAEQFLKLRELVNTLPGLESQTNLLLALCYQRQADTKLEIDTLRLLLESDPNHAAGRVALATTLMNQGDVAEAIKNFDMAAQSPYASTSTLSNWIRIQSIRLKLQSGTNTQWTDLERRAAQVQQKFGANSTEGVILRTDVIFDRGDWKRGLEVLRDEATRRPSDTVLWAHLAQKVAQHLGTTSGLSILDEAQAIIGDRGELRLARASISANDPSRLRPIQPLTQHIDVWPDPEQIKLLYGIIEIQDRIGDDAGVVETYRRMAGRRPAELPIWESLFERALKIADQAALKEARMMIQRLDTAEGESELICQAREILQARQADQAKKILEPLKKQFGDQPIRADVCTVLAQLQDLCGETAGGLQLLQRAVRLEPTRFAPTQALLEYYAGLEDSSQLRDLLTRLAQDYRWHGEPVQRAVLRSAKNLPVVSAKRLLDTVKPIVQLQPMGWSWLGQQYMKLQLPDEAQICFDNAVNSPVANMDDWLALAMFHCQNQQPSKAVETLNKAKSKLQENSYTTLLATFQECPVAPDDFQPKLEDNAEKRLYAQARLSLKLSRYQRGEAIQFLEEYLQENGITASDTGWAKRNLAMLLVARGGLADRTKARELLMQEDLNIGNTIEDQRATAAVLAGLSRHLDGIERGLVIQKAIDILAKVAKDSQDQRDRYLLSQLYRSAGQRDQGIAELRSLVMADPNNIDYLVAVLDEATRPEDFQKGEQYAERLMALYPTEYRAIRSLANFEFRANRPERSLGLAEGFARSAEDKPGDLQLRAALAAELLEDLARKPKVLGTTVGWKLAEAAIQQYETLLPTKPEAIVAVAGLFAAYSRPTDALAIIEKYSRIVPPRLKVMAGLALMRSAPELGNYESLVKEWLALAKNEEPNSPAVLMNEGEYFTLIGQTEQAELTFEQVLKLDEKNIIALNNLAWILAGNADKSSQANELLERAAREMGLTGDLLDTRARIRIGQKQYPAAESDLRLALQQAKTPLRWFHMALLEHQRQPLENDNIRKYFLEAQSLGLIPQHLHPNDRELYSEFQKKFE